MIFTVVPQLFQDFHIFVKTSYVNVLTTHAAGHSERSSANHQNYFQTGLQLIHIVSQHHSLLCVAAWVREIKLGTVIQRVLYIPPGFRRSVAQETNHTRGMRACQ
jgi:hypothetical protein